MFNFGRKKIKFNEDFFKAIDKKYRVKRYIELIIGVFLIAVSFNCFFLPNDIVFGGVSGIAIILKRFFGWEPSLIIALLSAFLLLISYIFLGKEKTIHSILGSLLYPLFVKLTASFVTWIHFESNDMLLVMLFASIVYGFGTGLVFKAGYTTGGTDILNQIASKYAKISLGQALIFTDGLILMCGIFVFGLTKFLYALLVLYITSILIDKVVLGISDSKAFYIITEEKNGVKEYILEHLDHTLTEIEGVGGYTKKKQSILMCIIPTKEYFKLKEAILAIDKDAFFIVTDAYEVLGAE